MRAGQPIDVPAAIPAPTGSTAANTLEVVGLAQSGAPKDSLSGSPAVHSSERRRGPGRVRLLDIERRLSDRDLAVLDVVRRHRFLTSEQIARFVFADHASPATGARVCRRVLSRLESLGLLERPLRRIGGLQGGSATAVRFLSGRGQRLLNLHSGDGAVGRVRDPGERFVAHYLAIADAHLTLLETARAGRVELLELSTEPECWRAFTGLGGSREVLKPDLYAVTARGDYEDHWFIEVDRATESLPTVIRQCRAYEHYRRQGDETTQHGVFPLVLWLTPNQTRADKIGAAIKAARGLDPGLYRVATQSRLLESVTGGKS